MSEFEVGDIVQSIGYGAEFLYEIVKFMPRNTTDDEVRLRVIWKSESATAFCVGQIRVTYVMVIRRPFNEMLVLTLMAEGKLKCLIGKSEI